RVVLRNVDQRVLLRELCERDPQRTLVVAQRGHDDRLQCRRGEMMLRVRTPYADGIADPDLGQAPELPDLTRAHGRAADAGTLVEDADGGHLALLRDPQPVSRSHRAGEHPDVRDLLAGGIALDLEDA